MLILANTLEFNGGATFVLRFCRENFKRGHRVGVLVMMDDPEIKLLTEIEKYADVYFLSSFISPIFRRAANTPLIGFVPVKLSVLSDVLCKYGDAVHVMGVFGLLFLSRLVKELDRKIKVSIGIYHQNEFMFSGVDYYFAKEARRLFCSLGREGMIFFNEANIASYSRFYRMDFSGSTLVPIGIDLPLLERSFLGEAKSRRIVSIGNLVEFKSYNSHIIKCMPGLLLIDPLFRYEIYGDGQYEAELRKLADEQGVSNAVEFKGRVPYSQLASVLDGAFLFVGSGTAIIEAAALGVPALIGIESTQQPITYGFLCDIDGFSYNELEPGRPLTQMIDKIIGVVSDADVWRDMAVACKQKAETFSMARTVEGFECRARSAAELEPKLVGNYSNLRALGSMLACAVKHKLGIDSAFANRRNQGTIL